MVVDTVEYREENTSDAVNSRINKKVIILESEEAERIKSACVEVEDGDEDDRDDVNKESNLIKSLVDTKKKELEAIIRTRDIMCIKTFEAMHGSGSGNGSPSSASISETRVCNSQGNGQGSGNRTGSSLSGVLSASTTTTSKTRRRKNKVNQSQSICSSKDVEFYNDLAGKALSWVAVKHSKRFAKYWKYEVKEKICILRVSESNKSKQEEIIREARTVGLYACLCHTPEWNFQMSVKERPILSKHNMSISVDNGQRTIVLAQSESMGKAAVEQANERIDALLEEKVSRLFFHADHLLKFSNKSASNHTNQRNMVIESDRTINNVFTEEELGPIVDQTSSLTESGLKKWLNNNLSSLSYLDDDKLQPHPCIEVIIRDGKEWILPRNYSPNRSDYNLLHSSRFQPKTATQQILDKSKIIAEHMVLVTQDCIQNIIYETERSLQSSDIGKKCRKFIFEDITLLQESFRRGNLQRQQNTHSHMDNMDHDLDLDAVSVSNDTVSNTDNNSPETTDISTPKSITPAPNDSPSQPETFTQLCENETIHLVL